MALARLLRSRSDLLLALGLTLIAQAEIWLRDAEVDRVAYATLALPITLSLMWRSRAPLLVLAVVVGVFFPSALLFPLSGDAAFAVAVSLLVAVYSVGAHTDGWQALVGVLLAVAVVFAVTFADPEGASPGSYVFYLFVVGGP